MFLLKCFLVGELQAAAGAVQLEAARARVEARVLAAQRLDAVAVEICGILVLLVVVQQRLVPNEPALVLELGVVCPQLLLGPLGRGMGLGVGS